MTAKDQSFALATHRRRREDQGHPSPSAFSPPTSPSSSSFSSIYPLHPPDSQWLARVSDTELTLWDKILVSGSSLVIVGSFVWVPALLVWAFRRWKRVRSRRRRLLYAALFFAALSVYVGVAPHKNKRVGQWIRVKQWKLWRAWIRFLAAEVLLDQSPGGTPQPGPTCNTHNTTISSSSSSAAQTTPLPPPLAQQNAILAFCPHGIFPFALGVAAITDWGQAIFGAFRPMVASAVQRVPLLGDLVGLVDGLDASKDTVDRALASGDRVGVIPGGISEMFMGYPRPGCHPDQETVLVRRGLFRMASRHQRPVLPIYCFGSTKLFRRLELPVLETLSNLLRISFILFYGVWGLPIPFRQRLTYIVGQPIVPPPSAGAAHSQENEAEIEAMHQAFCKELHRLFERHKDAYGWGHKTLQILSK
jgi:1-acyl-sn-glycerol-3-phosphate acyltransferase